MQHSQPAQQLHRLKTGGGHMDALEQTTAIHALALSLAKELSREDATRLGLLLIQLGTTLETIVALEDLNSGASSQALTV